MNTLDQIAANYSNGGHSLFGPSSSHAWLVCSGYLLANIAVEDLGNPESAYGTVAHGVTETWLRSGVEPRHLIGTKEFVPASWWGHYVDIDEEMLDHARECRDRCVMLPGRHLVEQRVDFSRLTPIDNQGGTLDFAALQPGRAFVIDHKFGKGVRVYAEENSQLMLYALGLLYEHDAEFDFKEIIIRINQPRLGHFDEWATTRDHLMEFAGYVKERAKAAWRIDAPRTADPHACQFCKVRSTCVANVQMQFRLMAAQTADAFNEVEHGALREFSESITDHTFDPRPVDPLELDTEQLALLRPYKGMVEKWWKSAEHELLRRALAGEPVPGHKLVAGRSSRSFKSDATAVTALMAAGCERTALVTEQVVSPAEAEKALIAAGHRRKDIPEILDGLIYKSPGKPTLAPKSDKRAELVDLTAVAFGDLSENSETEEL